MFLYVEILWILEAKFSEKEKLKKVLFCFQGM